MYCNRPINYPNRTPKDFVDEKLLCASILAVFQDVENPFTLQRSNLPRQTYSVENLLGTAFVWNQKNRWILTAFHVPFDTVG